MVQIALSSYVRRRSETLQTPLNNELILMNITSGNYFDFDSISADIWDRIVGDVQVCELVKDLTAKYEGDPSQIHDDVVEFLAFLSDNGLIETVVPGSP
jgi:hypothetical protein